MSEAKTFETLEKYARHIQYEMQALAAKIHNDPKRAGIYALSLCSEAAGIVQAARMNQEVEAGFDLSTLPKPQTLRVEDDPEGPYYRE